MTDMQEKYANKIAALLRKAESTTPEEAELLTDKAAQLMAQYAIEQAMVDAARGIERSEKIVEKRISYKSSYHHGLFELGSAIASYSDCRVLMNRFKNESVLYVIGFESDVERVVMLDASLQVQMQVALRQAAKRGDVRSEPWMTAMEKFKERRTFMFGFANGVRTRLYRAKQAGQKDYVDERLAAGEDESSVTQGMELVTRSRKDRVNDWVDEQYGQLRSGRSTRLVGGSSRARQAGREAGMNADTGSAGRVGQRRSLNR